ncbi:LIM and SH3 domain protein 1-like [Lineus longissimus]|uniref:LIM and SH3 domain protein 1-like n=1 Tax=Lineus longissimus TaxID=88925 RepID=UPI002B4D9E80
MNPQCSRCTKTVYPMEKLNCLDKYWHKACFNCETCHQTLDMKTYKGFNKLPYCNAHYPTTKHTTVADTPENLRLAQAEKEQSTLVYHKEFEAGKGSYTVVADDPESLRIKKAQAQASDIGYTTNISGKPAPRISTKPPNRHRLPTEVPPPTPVAGKTYVAVYDYSAADEDEVSFQEGDIIIDATVIDEGWMQGRVQRTGQYGMLPTNYAEAQ